MYAAVAEGALAHSLMRSAVAERSVPMLVLWSSVRGHDCCCAWELLAHMELLPCPLLLTWAPMFRFAPDRKQMKR